jgi:cobyrinic acid a,c-diamide synthase
MKAIVIGGVKSGCGKTSVSLGLMAALRRRGLEVRPFKAGPDFIDPGLHELAAGAPSHTLDGWMCSRTQVEDIFYRHCIGGDIAVIEGVMGLFDGFSGTCDDGSTAQLAKWLDLPVLLVADASSMARSAAALIQGYARYDAGLRLPAVALNRVASPNHADILDEAMTTVPGVTPIGFLPPDEDIGMPSRHLGLMTAYEAPDPLQRIDCMANWVEKNLDLDRLLALVPDLQPPAPRPDIPPPAPKVRIGLAHDAAFCFYYKENLRLLESAGAELVPFSPLKDKRLPDDLGGLYLGGGYPEVHAAELSNNTHLRRDVRAFAASGRPIYAECGGFMFLMENIRAMHGQTCQMAGVFPFKARIDKRFRALGYREIATTSDSILGPAGTMARGHEFHYSHIPEEAYEEAGLYAVSGRKGPLPGAEGFTRHNVVASYVHLHFASNPGLAHAFVQACASLS